MNYSISLFQSSTKALVAALALLFFIGSGQAATFDQALANGYAAVNGGKLYYEMQGKGRVVVLIHGGLVDSRLWDAQVGELARHYKVLRYDLRGFGRSDFSMGPLSHVDDLYALLKFLKIEKASLIGLSLGGSIATDFTLEHPEMVEKLVLTSSGLRGYQAPRNEQTAAVYRAAEEQGMDKAIEMWLAHPFFMTIADKELVRKMLAANFRTWGPTPQPIVWNWPTPPTLDRISQLTKPTLIIIGDRDVPAIISIADVLKQKINGARQIILTGVGHHLNMEKPKEYNRVVLQFLKEK